MGAAKSIRTQAWCMVPCNQAFLPFWDRRKEKKIVWFLPIKDTSVGYKDTCMVYLVSVIQGMPCISQFISHKVLFDVFLEHRTEII